ncbi:MAG: PRD domain-containing protein [Cellulosilyticaceae bacterium]
MEYRINKIYNNNVVLAMDQQREVVLVSKGVGFGRKPGDMITESYSIEKVFHEIDPKEHHVTFPEHKDDLATIQEVTRMIVTLAEKQLGILNENSEKALCEHIEFAVERLKIGISIENPFIDEIISLYREEYEVAIEAGILVKEMLGIELGEEEQGFIALHLYSARRNKSIKETMTLTRLYKGCIDRIEKEFDIKIQTRSTSSKEFLRGLRLLFRVANANKSVTFKGKSTIKKQLGKSSRVAYQIAEFVKDQKGIILTEDMIGFLTVDIEKLIQLT